MAESGSTIRLLRLADRLRMPAIASAAEALDLPAGSHGLDAGCGIGSHTELLLKTTAPAGRVTGLDAAADHVAIAQESAREKGLSDRAGFRCGTVESHPFEAGSFDWAWSVDCVGLIPGDPVELVRRLAGVVKPGGTVALVFWSSQLLLPGYPFLEARLGGTKAGAAPAKADSPPERHFLRSMGWFSRAGLLEPKARTFLVDLRGPLEEAEKEALASVIQMRWGRPETELSKEDWGLFCRLTDREGPDSIVDREDYFGFFTYSMFWATVPG